MGSRFGTTNLGSPDFRDHRFIEETGTPIRDLFSVTPVLRSPIREYKFKTTNLELLVSPFDGTTESFPTEVECITVHLEARFRIAKVSEVRVEAEDE